MKGARIPRAIESFYPVMSGPANQAFRLSKELEKRGIKSPILTTDYKASKSPRHEQKDGVEVFRFPAQLRFMKYIYAPSMKKKLHDFDLICAHSYRSYQSEIAYAAARRDGKPFILHNHGSVMGYRSFVKGWRRIPYIVYDLFRKKIALDADAVIVNTKQEYAEALKFGIDRKKIHIVPFGIDVKKYVPLKKKTGTLNLLWVGRITRDRNIDTIIKAVRILADEKKKEVNQEVKLRIVGNGFRRSGGHGGSEIQRLKDLAKSLEVSDKVEFVRWSFKCANVELRKADIFIYTSLWENLGQSILEAAAAGLPLVCTPVGVALELIEQGKTGYLVRQDNPKDVAKGILAFSERWKREIASKLLRDKLRREYSWKRIIETYINLCESLIKKGCRK